MTARTPKCRQQIQNSIIKTVRQPNNRHMMGSIQMKCSLLTSLVTVGIGRSLIKGIQLFVLLLMTFCTGVGHIISSYNVSTSGTLVSIEKMIVELITRLQVQFNAVCIQHSKIPWRQTVTNACSTSKQPAQSHSRELWGVLDLQIAQFKNLRHHSLGIEFYNTSTSNIFVSRGRTIEELIIGL